jgi:hypothetical protein
MAADDGSSDEPERPRPKPHPTPIRRKREAFEMTERRAQWIITQWIRDPMLLPAEMKRLVRQHFACGIQAADRAHQLAVDIRNEQFVGVTREALLLLWMDLLDRTRQGPNRNHERLVLECISQFTGHAAPKKVAIAVADMTPGGAGDLAGLADGDLDAACQFQDGILERVAERALGLPTGRAIVDTTSTPAAAPPANATPPVKPR